MKPSRQTTSTGRGRKRASSLRSVAKFENLRRSLPHELERGLGAISWLTRTGPSAARPLAYRLLERAGVLSQHPERFIDSPRLAPMPWGKGSFAAPPPAPPAGFDGPWPQEALVDSGFAAPVLGLEAADRRDHQRFNVLRYLGQVVAHTPAAALRALRGPRLGALDDSRFARIIDQTSLSQFICQTLDPADRHAFAPLLTGDLLDYAKVDASAVDASATLPGIHVAPTVTLLRREAPGRYLPLAIKIGDRVLRPTDGPDWALGRYFVLQGLQYLLVLVFHPRLHFPFDAINAISRALLPQGHLLYKLLRPHFGFSLGLNEAVIHHRRSVLHNSQREIYTPFPVTTEGIHRGVTTGMRGIEGNSAYPAFRFGPPLIKNDTSYGQYRRDWHDVYTRFAARVLQSVPAADPDVARWADQIAAWVPGFPASRELTSSRALAETAADIIVAISVAHTADHHSYSAIPIELMPWRLRRPPPDTQSRTQPHPAPLDLDSLVAPEDTLRHFLCHKMFFAPVLIRTLSEVRYDFRSPTLRAATDSLREDHQTLDARWQDSGFPSSSRIACSQQY